MTTQASPAVRVSRLEWARRVWPLGPIFSKELRQMARRKRSYALRFFYLGLLLAVLGFTWLIMSDSYRFRDTSIVAAAQRQAEMGRVFFIVFSLFSVVAMHLTGPVLTSTAIGSERLRRTFDVLLMTPISAWQLVAGKLFSRLLSAVVLLGLTLPVLSIVRLLGGVELEDMFGAFTLALSVATSSAAIGLLLSCWIKRAWAVIVLAYLIQFSLYGFFPMIVMMFASAAGRSDNQSMMRVVEVLCLMNPLLTTSAHIQGARGFSANWWTTAGAQFGMALALALLAAWVVRRIGRRDTGRSATIPPAPTPTPIPLAIGAPPPLPSSVLTTLPPPLPPPLPSINYESPSPRRAGNRIVSDYPILWRELRQPLLPRAWQRIAATTVTLVMLLLSYLAFAVADAETLSRSELQIGYAFVMHTLLMLMAVVLSATAIAGEKESDTWTLLIVSPIAGQSVMWGKFLGVLRRLMWPTILLVGHFGIFTLFGVLSIWSFLIVIWTAITFNLIWIATGVYLSLRVNRVTTAVVLNLLLPVLVYGLCPLALAALEYSVRTVEFRELSKIVLYWLPYWHLGEGISELSRGYYSTARNFYDSTFRAPYSDTRWPDIYLIGLTFFIGLAHLLIAAAIIWYCGARFDGIVKRAKQIDKSSGSTRRETEPPVIS